MLKRLITAGIAVLSLSACNEEGGRGGFSGDSKRSMSVIGSIRPKIDPEDIERIRQEEFARQQAERAQQMAQHQAQLQGGDLVSPWDRNLPKVETGPISGAIQPFGGVNMDGTSESSSAKSTTNQSSSPSTSSDNPFWPFGNQTTTAPPPPQPVATYGGYGSSGTAGLIPPPPAVTLSTQAQPMPPYGDYAAYYGHNPYAYPPPANSQTPQRPEGSLFGNSQEVSQAGGGADSTKSKKAANYTIITPTGMEARSPYKQRDDLKILYKAALNVSGLGTAAAKDAKLAQDIARVDVGLPPDASKGNVNLSQRQIDALFKGTVHDKRLAPVLKKAQSEVAQAYYRYLYCFNRFSLTQQTVQARKQELEIAETPAEKQRAAADLAKAQEEADSSKEDLRAAQNDLAAVSGAQAARSVISRVSGVAPSLESLAQAEQQQNALPESQAQKAMSAIGGLFGSMGSVLGLGKDKSGGSDGDAESGAVARAKPEKPEKVEKADKGKDKDKKDARAKSSSADAVASRNPAETNADRAEAEVRAPRESSGIAFELKDVETTPRKSILKVAIRNNSADSFSFDPEVVSVAEGDQKLAEAAVRADFNSTVVAPNSEVTGTITIFGRPWNSKLKVSLSEGGRTIHMHR